MERPRHPAGLPILFLTEMWERFSFYLMVGILPLYLTDKVKGGMGWSDKDQAVLTGTYYALVYLTPFIGGLIADRLLGYRNTILIGGSLMMVGHIILAFPVEWGLYLGLAFLVLGNGAFKPNISSLLGNLYPPGSHQALVRGQLLRLRPGPGRADHRARPASRCARPDAPALRQGAGPGWP